MERRISNSKWKKKEKDFLKKNSEVLMSKPMLLSQKVDLLDL